MEGLLNTLAISGASLVGKAAFSFATSRFVNEMTQKIKETSQKTKLGKEVEKLNSSIRQKLDLIRPSIELIQSTANKGNSNLNAALELIATFIENLNKTKNEILKDTHFQLVFENTTTEIKSKTEVSVLKTINQLKEIERDILDLTVYLTFTLQSNNLNFDTSLNLNHISTSILLKSSNYFNNVIYDENKNEFLVGPTFFVRLFSLFGANARKEDVQSWTWKEEFPKCTLNLKKPKPINEDEKCFKYFFSFTENLNDVPLSAAFCGFVVLTNLSLQYNSVGFYQMAKVLTTPCIVILQTKFYQKTFSSLIKTSLAVTCVGVIVVSVTDFSLNVVGTIFAMLGVVVGSTYQIWVGTKQKELNCDSFQLLYYQSFISFIILLISIPILDNAYDLYNYEFTTESIGMILFSAALAFFVNLSTFLIIGKTSAVTYNIVGHFKLCLILFLGFIIFKSPVDLKQIGGIATTLVGIFWYSKLKLADIKTEQLKPNNEKD
ncbi:hypothetical protein HK099_006547 [Clydaea vesicula]|uniref:Sugar phosphate transporter domain-containing protein n=1 Tax=Clydaea vesicula TaxID=447962 RepID=A0AAD5U2C0_9FUNG|nr:hypothetical protein HK099_006547 [Clydaea vesicula]